MTTTHGLSRYAISCGLLLIPAIAWNLAFTSKLVPASAMTEFWRDVPAPLVFTENALRALVFGLPFAMPLQISTKPEQRALLVFVLGTLVYFGSWLALMYWPNSAWSSSALGSLAPAYTPMLWLPSLALLGKRLFWGNFYRWWMYLFVCGGFLAAHLSHAALVYIRSA
ncbi:MAG: hypothetical protein ABIQ62_04500 [Thermomonas sp.]